MTKLNNQNVKAVCEKIAATYGAKLKHGPDCKGIEALSHLLDAMGVIDAKVWLANYSVTLGHTVYLCFKPGATDMKPSDQVAVVAHECVHVSQAGAVFAADYLTSSAHRAAYEAYAMRTQLAVEFFLTGKMQSYENMAEGLTHYACSQGDIHTTKTALFMASRLIRRGGMVDPKMIGALRKALSEVY